MANLNLKKILISLVTALVVATTPAAFAQEETLGTEVTPPPAYSGGTVTNSQGAVTPVPSAPTTGSSSVTQVTNRYYPTSYVTIEKNASYEDKVEWINGILASTRKVEDKNYKLGFRAQTTFEENQILAQTALENGYVVALYGVDNYGFKLKRDLPPEVVASLIEAQGYANRKVNQAQNERLAAQGEQIEGLAKGQKAQGAKLAEVETKAEAASKATVAISGRLDGVEKDLKENIKPRLVAGERSNRNQNLVIFTGGWLMVFLIGGLLLVGLAAAPAVPRWLVGLAAVLLVVGLMAITGGIVYNWLATKQALAALAAS